MPIKYKFVAKHPQYVQQKINFKFSFITNRYYGSESAGKNRF